METDVPAWDVPAINRRGPLLNMVLGFDCDSLAGEKAKLKQSIVEKLPFSMSLLRIQGGHLSKLMEVVVKPWDGKSFRGASTRFAHSQEKGCESGSSTIKAEARAWSFYKSHKRLVGSPTNSDAGRVALCVAPQLEHEVLLFLGVLQAKQSTRPTVPWTLFFYFSFSWG